MAHLPRAIQPMLWDYTRIRTYGHARIQQSEQRTCGNRRMSVRVCLILPERAAPRRRAPRRRRSRPWPNMTPPPAPLPPGQQCFCLCSSASHAADKHAATSHVQRGPVTAAIARPLVRGSRSPPAGSRPQEAAARVTRIQRRGHRGDTPLQERRRERTRSTTRCGGATGRCLGGEETSEAGEWSKRRRRVDLTRRGGGWRASEGRGREPPLAVPSAARREESGGTGTTGGGGGWGV